MPVEDAALTPYSPDLRPEPKYSKLSVTESIPFQGGQTHHRPLLKAAQRGFNPTRHTAQQVSRRIRCADSQPGVLSKVFGCSLYIYGGIVEDNIPGRQPVALPGTSTMILGTRDSAVCIATCDGRGVWITHVRRPKGTSSSLWPKIPAAMGLIDFNIMTAAQIKNVHWPSTCDWSPSSWSTFQEIWIDFDVDENYNKTAYLYFDFYNGAMSTDQCSRLIDAMDYILSESTHEIPIHVVAFMGGSYFSNGIALNVIKAAADPAQESWLNINRINDVVHYILHEFSSHGILTIAAMRGNAAAGGVALAAACDIVTAGSEIVLNPAYRAIGLYGSEYHSLSYYGRCGKANATRMLRDITPLSPLQAQRIGLVDYVFPGTGAELEDYIRTHISMLLKPGCLKRGFWKAAAKVDLSPASLARARAMELSEMSKDFWSPRSSRYHSRRFDFVRKVKPLQAPLRFAKHRRDITHTADVEETDVFDSVEQYRKSAEEALMARLRSELHDEMKVVRDVASSTPRPKTPALNLMPAPKKEHLFSCYYKPMVEALATPPETPLETPLETPQQMALMGSFFRPCDAGKC
ncbi:hypothetical protein LTR37_013359 [Vermiconidia calcicola]|uniref:Uncharacterized protein n=1 Tax=Vermiconidia calcicola TaxID=1690605 RepID=A0ACC3MWS2_9PEZI|nr:hypothetical protein LTR37_013359 [Vermiconidia calcicola]